MTPPLLGPNGQPIDVGAARDELGTLDRQVVDMRAWLVAKAGAEKVAASFRSEVRKARARGWRLLVRVTPEGYDEGVYVAYCRLEPQSPLLARRLKRMTPPQAYVEARAEFGEAAHVVDALKAAIDAALEFAAERVE